MVVLRHTHVMCGEITGVFMLNRHGDLFNSLSPYGEQQKKEK